MDNKTECSNTSCQNLLLQLKESNEKLHLAQQALAKSERLLEKTNRYNEELVNQIEKLSQQLHQYRQQSIKKDGLTQTEDSYFLDPATAKQTYEDDWVTQSENSQLSVAECVRAAAEEAIQSTDFVYDESTGLYYDSLSGYYYDPENALYYNSATGIYYQYDYESHEYKFHSQVEIPQPDVQDNTEDVVHSEKKKKEKRNKKKVKKQEQSLKDSDNTVTALAEKQTEISEIIQNEMSSEGNANLESMKSNLKSAQDDETIQDSRSTLEEGECSSSSNGSSCTVVSEGDDVSSSSCSTDTSTSNWPPCIRAIVIESSIEEVQIGTLFLVTCTGAVVGRETSNDVCIPDIQISKEHAKIDYDFDNKHYQIKDLGSQNGTILNGSRLSEVKESSDYHLLSHGDELILGSVKLKLHIHVGLETCDDCEPGQIQAKQDRHKEIIILSKEEKEHLRKKELKQIKKKFGLKNVDYEDVTDLKLGNGYSNRADERRKTKGIDNPYGKTETASIHVPISKKNKGFTLMEKMGWTAGEALGKSQEGIVNPISTRGQIGKSGLGCTGNTDGPSTTNTPEHKKQKRWQKTQKRYWAIAGQKKME